MTCAIMAAKTGLRVFFDYLSQPSRAVLLLLHANNIKYEPQLVSISQGENRTREDFTKVNPNKKLPAIDDNGFCLFESSAILKYIATKYKVPDHWYPSDVQRRAKVDEYLSWHTSNLRVGASHTIFHKLFLPLMTGRPPDEKRLEENEKLLKRSLRLFETYFLKDHKFISGDEISIADLQALCEFTQYAIADADPCRDSPRLAQWMSDCRSALQPHFDEVHKVVYVTRERGMFKGKL